MWLGQSPGPNERSNELVSSSDNEQNGKTARREKTGSIRNGSVGQIKRTENSISAEEKGLIKSGLTKDEAT